MAPGFYAADANKKFHWFHAVFDLEVFRPLNQKAVRSSLGLNGEKILLYVGRVEPIKGLDLGGRNGRANGL
ncbi:MAG: hypothetical protein Ct9H300mP11_22240 [Chloroflexota bacterium]|nr:MAG: hypothetical protein Ct9H300mP11_22240 [Chloroflexota bacterium]